MDTIKRNVLDAGKAQEMTEQAVLKQKLRLELVDMQEQRQIHRL